MKLTRLVLPLAALALTAGLVSPSHADRIDSPNARPGFAVPPPHLTPIPAEGRAAVKQLVLKRRRLQIERLRQYRLRGMFPRNTYANKILRVLVDDDGRFCAVANMIALDGQRLLVLKTAKTNRFVNFRDVNDGPLMDWVLTSGITKAEIAAIQLPDSPIRRPRENVGIFDGPVIPVAVQVERERRRLVAHLLKVERLLLRQMHKSVDQITDHIVNNPKLLIALVKSMKHTNVQPI